MKDAASLSGLPFCKMHGAGNDFVIVWSRGAGPRLTGSVARRLADRRRGVGCDQVVEVSDSQIADLRLTFFNADGSRSGACGNATRCVAATEMAQHGQDRLTLESDRGVLAASRGGNGAVWVNMGAPVFDWRQIPLAAPADIDALPLTGAPLAVGMGNPHAVHFVEDADAVELAVIGPAVETDPLFPERTNVEIASLRKDGTLRLRVWERGAGMTPACGSGACAAAVAAHRRGLTGRSVWMQLDGDWLHVDWREDGVWLTGPVAHVFDGVLSPDLFAATP